MRRLIILTIVASCAAISTHAQNWSLTGGAAGVSWNTYLRPLGPGWHIGHPVGALGVEYRNFFAEASGDPHAPKEANSWSMGIKFNALHYHRINVYGKFGAGEVQTASFEYYGNHPNYCWWWTLSAGVGLRVRISNHWSIDAIRADYLATFEVPQRYRVYSGFVWRFK